MDVALIIIASVFCFLAVVAFFNGIARKDWEPWERILKIIRVFRFQNTDRHKQLPKSREDSHEIEKKLV
jgi:hypothetical protein